MNFKSGRWTAALLIFLILLAVTIFIQFSLGLGVFKSDIRNSLLGLFSKSPFYKQSEVRVYLQDSNLKFDFEITEEERSVFSRFVSNWFDKEEEIKSVSFGVDENLSGFLLPVLPADLKIKFTDKSVEFRNQSVTGLQTALTGTEIDFATGSGKIRLKYSNPTEYKLGIENPEDLAFYATESGILTASSKISGLFKSLPQVATIEMEVSGKNISGSIKLK